MFVFELSQNRGPVCFGESQYGFDSSLGVLLPFLPPDLGWWSFVPLFPFGRYWFHPLPLCVVLRASTSPWWCCGSSSWFCGALSPLSFSVVRGHNSSTLDVFFTVHYDKRLSRKAYLLAKARTCSSFGRKESLFPCRSPGDFLQSRYPLSSLVQSNIFGVHFNPLLLDSQRQCLTWHSPPLFHQWWSPGFLLDLRFENEVRRPQRKTILHPGGTLGCLSQSGTQDGALRPIVQSSGSDVARGNAHRKSMKELEFEATELCKDANVSNEPPRGELRDCPNDDPSCLCREFFLDRGSFGVLFFVWVLSKTLKGFPR